MKRGTVTYTVDLPKPVTGLALAEAAKAVAEANGEEAVRRETTLSITDGKRLVGCEVGQCSLHPAKDVRIEVPDGEGWSGQLSLDATYARVRFINWWFQDRKYAIRESEEGVIHAVEDFRDKLIAALGA